MVIVDSLVQHGFIGDFICPFDARICQDQMAQDYLWMLRFSSSLPFCVVFFPSSLWFQFMSSLGHELWGGVSMSCRSSVGQTVTSLLSSLLSPTAFVAGRERWERSSASTLTGYDARIRPLRIITAV